MSLRTKIRAFSAILLGSALIPAASAQISNATGDSILQKRYETAQKYQSAQDLDRAANEYQIFLADALGEVAIGRAHAGDYDRAAADFDEVFTLVPDFPMMQIEYARAALASGHLEHAKLLSSDVLRKYPQNAKAQADAHAVLGQVLLKMDKNAEAKEQFERAVALDSSFENGYALAVAELNLGDRTAAANLFVEMLASFGDTAAIHMYFGQAYGNSDFQSDAVDEFRKAIAENDHLPWVHYSLAAALLATQGDANRSEAIAELRKEIALFPDEGTPYAALGHLLADDSQTPSAEAERDLKRGIQLDPSSPDGYLYLGQIYASQKKSAEAEKSLRQSIALTREVSRNKFQVQKAHYLLGRLLMQNGQTEEGKRELAASQLLMQQNLSQARGQMSDYLGDHTAGQSQATVPPMPMSAIEKPLDLKASKQVDEFEKRISPAVADSYNNLGAIAGSKHNYLVAMHYFERAGEWNPSLPGLDYNFGRAAFEAKAFPRAIGPLSRYLSEHTDDASVRAELGMSQFMTGDYRAARNTLQAIEGGSAASLQVEYAYAASLLETGDEAGGVTRLVAIEKKHPTMAEVHRSLGKAYAARQNPDAAAELEMAVRLNPRDAESHALLADLQSAQGDIKNAAANLEAAIELEPNNSAWRQALQKIHRKAADPH
jgi:tetratricopeptide (TPR) repeat protein